MNKQQSDPVEHLLLRRHNRFRITTILSIILPMGIMFGLSILVAHPAPALISVIFVVVGALNLYIIESRPVVDELELSNSGLRFQFKGETRTYALNQIQAVREKKLALRFHQRLELDFNDGQSLRIYSLAMRIETLNNQAIDFKFTDLFHPTWRVWDRPTKLVRSFFIKHNLLEG